MRTQKVLRNTVLAMLVVSCIGSSAVWATSYNFSSTSYRLRNMDHSTYSVWGLDWGTVVVPEDEVIDGATLYIDGLYDWTVEDGDVLHVWLLDELPNIGWSRERWPGVSYGWDNQYDDTDAFASSGGTHIVDYSDPAGGYWSRQDVSWAIPVDPLKEYIENDELFGFGFDADCHYYDSKVRLVVTTSQDTTPSGGPVPEPLTMLGLLLGVGSAGGYVRNRARAVVA